MQARLCLLSYALLGALGLGLDVGEQVEGGRRGRSGRGRLAPVGRAAPGRASPGSGRPGGPARCVPRTARRATGTRPPPPWGSRAPAPRTGGGGEASRG